MRRTGYTGSFWPSPTQEALLRMILGHDERVLERWRALQPLDIDTLEVGSFCLLPHVHSRLSALAPDEPLLPRLAGTYRNTWYRNQLRLERLSRLVASLDQQGIETVVVGGATIAARWYAQLGLRPIAQLEVAVDSTDAQTVTEAARGEGWRGTQSTREYARFVDDGMVLVGHAGALPDLAGTMGSDAALRELAAHSQELELGEVRVRVLDAQDEMLFACALGARAALPPTVQWLLDAAQVLASPNRPQPASLIQRAGRFRLVPSLRATVAYLDEVAETLDLRELAAGLQSALVPTRDILAFRLNGGAGRVGVASQTLANHVRATAADSLPHAVARLPSHLQMAWGLESISQVPSAALRKLVRRTRRPPMPQSGPPGGDHSLPQKHSTLS